MRIIQLVEADLNAILGIVFGKLMVTFAAKHCKLNESQFGRPGVLCQSAMVNIIISFEISRIVKKENAAMEVDAEGFYYHIIPELVAISCRWLGMPVMHFWMLLDILNRIENFVQTQFR